MATGSYETRRDELESYFDRTAVKAWANLTTDKPLGRIRASVRDGRNQMRDMLLSWLPDDLRGRRVLDAGCGTGALAVELARRGADVLAVDLSPNLIALAIERVPRDVGPGRIEFRAGDMARYFGGRFDHVMLMDSVIHYGAHDIVAILSDAARAVTQSLVFTFVPRTPLLAAMHAAGRLFPSGSRSPSFEPLGEERIRALIGAEVRLAHTRVGRTSRISSGFYKSQALELACR